MEPLRVGFVLGCGDAAWGVQKARGLSKLHGGRPIEAHITRSPNHSSVDFLRLCGPIDTAIESEHAPFDILNEFRPSHRDPKWATLEGARGFRGLDYVLQVNGHLETGGRIEEFLPEVETDFRPPLRISEGAIGQAREVVGRRPVLLYMSGIGPNAGFHANTWAVEDWVSVVRLLNDAGLAPVLMGARSYDDVQYAKRFDYLAKGLRYVNAVGKTSMESAFAAILDCRCWIGLNSGLGIVGASQGVPTVMLWSDSEYPIEGCGAPLHTEMKRAWLPKGELSYYRMLSFGSPGLTAENVVASALEVMR